LIILIIRLLIYWNGSGTLVSMCTEESFFILKFDANAVTKARSTNEGTTEDGIDDAFDVSEILRCSVIFSAVHSSGLLQLSSRRSERFEKA